MRKPFLATLAVALAMLAAGAPAQAAKPPLWKVYDNALMDAKYVDLTHTITPKIPVWSGFGPSTFAPADEPGDRPAVHVREPTASRPRATCSRPTSSGRSSTRPRTGRRSRPRSTSCRRRSPSARWS